MAHRGEVERTLEAQHERQVVDREGRIELVDEPHALLRQRQRNPLGQRGRATRAGALGAACVASDARARAGHGRAPRTAHARRLDVPKRRSMRATTWVATSELPPRSKKLSSTPTRSMPEHIGEDRPRRSPRPGCAARRNRLGDREDRLRQRLAVELAAGVERERVEHDDRRGNHVRRQHRRRRVE